MRLRLLGTLPDEAQARLEALAPTVAIVEDDAEALLWWGGSTAAALAELARHPRLQWLHQCSSGVGAAMREACVERHLTLTNGRGAHGPALGEYVVMA
ncbi:MAG: hypothetical protein WBC33_12035, partial [Conexibacter sp.]